jgi:hypothetical protein
MPDNPFGDFFLSDDDGQPSDPVASPPPSESTPPEPVDTLPHSVPAPMGVSVPVETTTVPAPSAPVAVPDAAPAPVVGPEPEPPVAESVPAAPSPSVSAPAEETREQRLTNALNGLMTESPDIQAAALVSLDGFTMASALPEGMQEDRVGAMSAAILGLGERAALELGRGKLSQVFIEGEGGYVVLMAAGTRSVLTCLADEDAKLGLLIYDVRATAEAVGEILG